MAAAHPRPDGERRRGRGDRRPGGRGRGRWHPGHPVRLRGCRRLRAVAVVPRRPAGLRHHDHARRGQQPRQLRRGGLRARAVHPDHRRRHVLRRLHRDRDRHPDHPDQLAGGHPLGADRHDQRPDSQRLVAGRRVVRPGTRTQPAVPLRDPGLPAGASGRGRAAGLACGGLRRGSVGARDQRCQRCQLGQPQDRPDPRPERDPGFHAAVHRVRPVHRRAGRAARLAHGQHLRDRGPDRRRGGLHAHRLGAAPGGRVRGRPVLRGRSRSRQRQGLPGHQTPAVPASGPAGRRGRCGGRCRPHAQGGREAAGRDRRPAVQHRPPGSGIDPDRRPQHLQRLQPGQHRRRPVADHADRVWDVRRPQLPRTRPEPGTRRPAVR